MARRPPFTRVALMGLTLLCAVSAAGQGQRPAPGQGPGGKPGTRIVPDSLPDLVVTSVKVTLKCVANKTVTADIAATVKNQSLKATADLSKVTWNILLEATWGYISGSGNLETPSVKPVMPQLGGPKALKPGESWTGTLTITGIPRLKQGGTKGDYSFGVAADPLNGVAESDEKNNEMLAYASDPCVK